MNERELVDGCVVHLRGRYSVVSAIVVGSAASDPGKALDLDLCVVVKEEILDRARIRVCGREPTSRFTARRAKRAARSNCSRRR